MSKPKLNTNAMLEELGAVASFANQRPQDTGSSTPPKVALVEPIPEAPGEPEVNRVASLSNTEAKNGPEIHSIQHANFSTPIALSPDGLTPVRTPVRRTITRYAFEFYQDQVESLRSFSLEEKTRGEQGSMSAMVRQAIDDYIAKRVRLEQ